MPQKEFGKESNTPNAGVMGWPNDWYIYKNGEVLGPLSANETFSKSHSLSPSQTSPVTQGESDMLVCRKGFTQWYPYYDLASLYQTSESHSKNVTHELEKLENILKTKETTSKEPENILQKQSVKQKELGPELTALKKIAAPVKAQNRDKPKPKQTGTSSHQLKKVAKSSEQKTLTPLHFGQEYFALKGRFRLGPLNNPYFLIMKCTLTLGISWWFWFKRTLQDVSWHMTGAHHPKNWPPIFLAALPIAHIYMAYRLALFVRQVENQNHYQVIRPWLAALLAIFPPFAMYYIQDTINRHWRLHVKYVVKQKYSQQTR